MGHTTTEPTGAPGPAWLRAISRAVLIVVVIAALFVAAPLLRGAWDGVFPPGPVPADQLPAWRAGHEPALAESAETGRPVLLYFTADWCPPCKVMERETWSDETVREEIAARVIPVEMDVDDPAVAASGQRYKIVFIPTVVLVDARGREIAREGFASAGRMAAFLREHAPAVAPSPTAGPAAGADPLATGSPAECDPEPVAAGRPPSQPFRGPCACGTATADGPRAPGAETRPTVPERESRSPAALT